MATADTITLDNLSEKLPLWHRDDENHLYAIVDMGSNGIRFSITSLEPPCARLMVPVYSTRAAISLFDALTPSPSGLVFPQDIISSVASAISRFHHLAIIHGVPPKQIMVLATEAMRRAANAPEMLNAIQLAAAGLKVHILDPAVETLLGAVMGSKSGLGTLPRGALFLDLGGGSVQMTWVDTSDQDYPMAAARAGQSLPYGAAKLIRILEELPEDTRAAELANLKNGFKSLYANLCSKFPALQAIKSAHENGEDSFVDVYMCGGGFRGYGSMLMHSDPIQPYPIPTSTTYSVPGSQFKSTAKMLDIHKDCKGKIFELSKRRRQQFPAIVAVVDAFIEAVPNIGWVTFCGGSNRQGALTMKLPQEVRESNPLDILANVKDHEKLVFDTILQKLSSSLPLNVDLTTMPTIFNTGLSLLFVREAWNRHGHDSDSNSAFALHHAISRDTDSPGLTHLTRAILGIGIAARWGGNLGPVDTHLYNGLRGIIETRHRNASYWVQYLGGVASILAAIFPRMPARAIEIANDVSFHSQIQRNAEERVKVILNVGLAAERAKGINLDELAKRIKEATEMDDETPAFKSLVQINVQTSASN